MNSFSYMTDEEFVPFLKGLGVETYGKSFEWLLNDPDTAGVLKWLYNNFDQNNALTPREEYRYIEISKQEALLTPEELEQSLTHLTDEYPGLVLPGDQESLEVMRQDVEFNKERLNMLQHHEETVAMLIKENELSKEELSRQITKLNSFEIQCKEDIDLNSKKCLSLAEEVEGITENVVDTIADIMYIYSNTQLDMELSRKFFTFGPFEAYKQSQRLFKSHFDLYCSRKFNTKQNNPTDDNTKAYLIMKAKNMENRLYKAIIDYVESKAELGGVHAMMRLLSNYQDVHVNQMPISMMESTSAVELLEQEELILKRQVQDNTKCYVEARTRATAACATMAALKQREVIYKDLCWLAELSQSVLSLDRLIYHAVRRELRDCQDVMQFAMELRSSVLEDQSAVNARIASMQNIISQQEEAEKAIENTDKLLEILSTIFGTKSLDGFSGIMKRYGEMKNELIEIKDGIETQFVEKEERIKEFIQSTENVRKYINDGCTRLPNCWDRTVATLTHALRDQIGMLDVKVSETSGMYAAVKTGDKQNLRKLWQWFLTDEAKFLSKFKNA